jgi:hypothetical protein
VSLLDEVQKRHNPRVMRWKTTLAILAALCTSIALADDFKTINGKEYKNVNVSRVEPDGIVLTTKDGISKVYFTELPKDVQERFGYTAQKVEREGSSAIKENELAEQDRSKKEQNALANLAKSVQEFEAAEKQAAQSYQTVQTGTLSGQIFVATKGGENIKLGAVQVSLFARDAIDLLLAGVNAFANAKIELLPLAAARQAEQQAKAAEQQAEVAEQQAEAAEQQAQAAQQQAQDTAKTAWDIYHRELSDNNLRTTAEGAKGAAEGAKAAADYARSVASAAYDALNGAREAVVAATERYDDLVRQRDFYHSVSFYFGHLRSPIQTSETDAEGKFVIKIPRAGKFVIAAQAQRSVGEDTETYHWLQPVSLEGQQELIQNLSNSNLLTSMTGGPGPSLIHTED